MRILIQRVTRASVSIEGEIVGQREIVGEIGRGLLAFVGFKAGDDEETLNHLAQKLANLRILGDADGKMNYSLIDLDLECLIVSQFTLYGDARKGNRPSFTEAERPEIAEILYDRFVEVMRQALGSAKIAQGRFGAAMQVELVNDGPVTILLDRENKTGA